LRRVGKVPDGFSTLTGVVLGTAGYLAPEQILSARSSGSELTSESDVSLKRRLRDRADTKDVVSVSAMSGVRAMQV